MEPDKDANKALYGKEMTATEIVNSAPIVPAEDLAWVVEAETASVNFCSPGEGRKAVTLNIRVL